MEGGPVSCDSGGDDRKPEGMIAGARWSLSWALWRTEDESFINAPPDLRRQSESLWSAR